MDELKLAVAWNRVDIAKSDIFNGDVEWKVRQITEQRDKRFVTLHVDVVSSQGSAEGKYGEKSKLESLLVYFKLFNT